jgi:hypothetical protein
MKRKKMIAAMRVPGKYPNGHVVRSKDDDKICIHWQPDETGWRDQTLTRLSTRDARLLAKRINQFIDAGG